jgi:hypothetical protein
MAHPGRLELNQHFAGAGSIQLDRFDGKRLSGLECDSSANVHLFSSRCYRASVTIRHPTSRLEAPDFVPGPEHFSTGGFAIGSDA